MDRWKAPAFAVLAAVGLSAMPAQAKPPAYTMANVGFTTQLHGVEPKPEDCLDEACHERAGAVVAEGESRHKDGSVRIVIREHKTQRGLSTKQLEKLARKLGEAKGRAKSVRLVSGTVGGKGAVEHWVVTDACERELTGRVLVALEGKVIEIETRTTVGTQPHAAKLASERMHRVLSGVRVRRFGDAALDPAKEPAAPEDIASALPKKGC